MVRSSVRALADRHGPTGEDAVITTDPAAAAGARPTFTLTFDTELIWGSFDHLSPRGFEARYPDVRGTIAGIVELLERYEVSATWAVVGHLFLDRCERDANGVAHPELPRPGQRWRPGDWYALDPCTDRERDPLWYGTDILDRLQATRVPQDIGCHSFSHVVYADPDLTRQAVDAELDLCLRLAAARGIEMRSFVFPRNVEGHHEALQKHGFRAFRGGDRAGWAGLPRPLARPLHLASHIVATPPPVGVPTERLPGLWEIPGSMLFIHRTGARRAVSRSARLRKARAGLQRALDTGGVFHLWTHPFNVASDRPYMLGVLDDILREATAMRDRGDLLIEPMAAVAERSASSRR